MSFIEARLTNQSVPRAREVPVAAGEAFEKGALGTLVDGEFEEATSPAATPGDVTYVSQSPFGASTGQYGATAGNRLEFPPGRSVVTDAFVTSFRAEFEDDLPAAPGGTYDAVRGTDGLWRVDFSAAGTLLRYLGPVSDLPSSTVPRLVEVEFVKVDAVE